MAILHGQPRTNWECISIRTGVGQDQYVNEDVVWDSYLQTRDVVKEMIATYRKHGIQDAWIFVVLRYGEWDQIKYSWTSQEGWQY